MRYLLLLPVLLTIGCTPPLSPDAAKPSVPTQIVPGQMPREDTFTVSTPFCAKYPGYDFCASYCQEHPGVCP